MSRKHRRAVAARVPGRNRSWHARHDGARGDQLDGPAGQTGPFRYLAGLPRLRVDALDPHPPGCRRAGHRSAPFDAEPQDPRPVRHAHPHGGISGAALTAVAGSMLPGAIVGIIGAVAGTLGGHALRAHMAATFGRDRPAALLEDAIAVGAAFALVLLSR